MKHVSTSLTRRVRAIQFPAAATAAEWHPAINVYRCEEQLMICLDLAGVEIESIEVEVSNGDTIRIRGRRRGPEPDCDRYKVLQVLALEIDHGQFEREIHLPFSVGEEGLKTEHRDGFFWIEAPVIDK
jgi:HSP20 family protein